MASYARGWASETIKIDCSVAGSCTGPLEPGCYVVCCPGSMITLWAPSR